MAKRKIKLFGQKPSVKELDSLCRRFIFLRDGDKCVKCGRTNCKLDWAHFLTRGNKAIRWDEDASLVLCSGCHTMRLDSFHKDPAGTAEFMKKRLGEEKYDALRLRAAGVKKVDRWAVQVYLEAKIRELM